LQIQSMPTHTSQYNMELGEIFRGGDQANLLNPSGQNDRVCVRGLQV